MLKTVALSTLPSWSKTDTAQAIFSAYAIPEINFQLAAQNLEHVLQGTVFKHPHIHAGQSLSILDQLNASDLTESQKSTLLATLAGILHEHQTLAKTSAQNPFVWENSMDMKALYASTNHYVNNWFHIVEELLHLFILNAVSTVQLSRDDLANALLASSLTDSKKGPGPKEVFVHHLNAVEHTSTKLSALFNSSGFDSTAIEKSILKHQFAPPFVMALMATILLPPSDEKQAIIDKLKNPYAHLTTLEDGTSVVNFTAAEKQALKTFDPRFAEWYLPTPGFEKDAISWLVVMADAMQYPGSGIFKVLPIRGPKTFIPDPTLMDSIHSVLGSENDNSAGACLAFFPEGPFKELYTSLIQTAVSLVEQSIQLVKTELKLDDTPVPFLETPLKTQHVEKDGKSQLKYDESEDALDRGAQARDLFCIHFKAAHIKAISEGRYFQDMPKDPSPRVSRGPSLYALDLSNLSLPF